MKRTLIPFVAMLLGGLAACGGNTTMMQTNLCLNVTCTNGQTCDATTGMCTGTINKCFNVTCTGVQSCDMTSGMCANPAMPTLNAANQIDRMARPAVNTALTNPYGFQKFNGNAETSDATKDRYNGDSNSAMWPATWAPNVAANLAVLDGLDTKCGNQLLAAAALTATRYSGLAGLLAGDVLNVDTSKTMCMQYLGVELATPNDCGGRTLTMDVMDTTYSALAVGTPTGVSDGINASSGTALAAFPYLAAPI